MEAWHTAARALALDDRDPYAHYASSWACLSALQHGQALAEAQRSIDLNPNFALGFFALGLVRVHIGHFTEAIDPLLRSLRLNPNDAQASSFTNFVTLAHYHQENYEEAFHYAQRAVRPPRAYFAVRTLCAVLGQLDRASEAAPLIEELERRKPEQPERYFELTTPYEDRRHRDHLMDGLRKAGAL